MIRGEFLSNKPGPFLKIVQRIFRPHHAPNWIAIYLRPMPVNVKKSYVWTVVYEMNTKAIFYSNEHYLSSSESKIAFIFIS